MAKTKPFDEHLSRYEQWFVENHFVFRSELKALQKAIPGHGRGVEIGAGSGIFARELGIKEGIEPSYQMRKKAIERGINAIDGVAENLPYPDKSFDFVLMVTTLCFVDDVIRSFNEVSRILKNKGKFIIGFVDKNSPVGIIYQKNKHKNVFYKDAYFYNVEEVFEFLKKTGFKIEVTWQTIFRPLNEISKTETPEKGYGKGSFVVVKVSFDM